MFEFIYEPPFYVAYELLWLGRAIAGLVLIYSFTYGAHLLYEKYPPLKVASAWIAVIASGAFVLGMCAVLAYQLHIGRSGITELAQEGVLLMRRLRQRDGVDSTRVLTSERR
jgi:hypothetical protein